MTSASNALKGNQDKTELDSYPCFFFYNSWRKINDLYKKKVGNDISPQNIYLLELCSTDQPMKMKELSEGMKLDGSAVSALISRMEKKGWLERTHSKHDRRVVTVLLTEKGQEVREHYSVQFEQINEILSQHFPKDVLDNLNENIDAIRELGGKKAS